MGVEEGVIEPFLKGAPLGRLKVFDPFLGTRFLHD